MDLLFASTNSHKYREYKELFQGATNIHLLSLKDFPYYVQPEETGDSFEENAILKAEHAAKTLQVLAFADDSGLLVPSLGKNSPGVHSARYAGENANDAANRQKLLTLLKEKSGKNRAAYFECWIALVDPFGGLTTFDGRCKGFITEEEKGEQGFGYDPIFFLPEIQQTFAELTPEIKNKFSHRYQAFNKFIAYLNIFM
ncbi:MAG: non-canonical purine NTP pyrophosphatase [Chlamydiales bacterium]